MSIRLIPLLLVLLANPLAAQTADPTQPLQVGLRLNAPFVEGSAEAPQGIAVELWEQVADRLARDYVYTGYDSVQDLLAATAAGEVDVAVAATTVTAERAAGVDFSHPYFRGGIGIATAVQSGWGSALASLVSPDFLKAVGVLLLVLLAVGLLVWLAERRRNAEQFGGKALEGIGNGLWWSAVTMTTVGYGDKAPATLPGRVVALVWMFVSIITISGFTAAIASSFTVERLATRVEAIDDLDRVRVATLADTTSALALRARGLSFRTVSNVDAGLDQLAAGDIDALVYDAPILRAALIRRDDSDLRVLAQRLQSEDYAFALPIGSTLRKPLNEALLETVRSDDWLTVLTRFLGDEE